MNVKRRLSGKYRPSDRYAWAASGPLDDNSTWGECWGVGKQTSARIIAAGTTCADATAAAMMAGGVDGYWNSARLYRRAGACWVEAPRLEASARQEQAR